MKITNSSRSFALLAIVMALIVASVSVNAVPAMRGIWKVLKLMDGTEVRAELRGDEHFHYWKSADGKRYVESEKDGVYRLIDESAFRSRARALSRERATMLKSARSKLPESVLTGSHRGLVILVDYPDKDIRGNRKYEFQEEHTKEFYQWITNTKTSLMSSVEGQKLINAGYAGSVFDYFYTQSNGKFSIQFDVVGPYTLSHKRKYYGANEDDNGNKYDRDAPMGPREMVVEACELAATDPDVDFARYDWDNDDIIDLVYVIYADLGEAFGGDANSVWPGQFDFTYVEGEKAGTVATTFQRDENSVKHSLLFGGKNLNRCACSSELETESGFDGYARYDSNGEIIIIGGNIGTICHEFSHCLGLMDHYIMNDPKKEKYALGAWDVMASGSYNGQGKKPAGYNSFEKAFLGWLDPIEVGDESVRVRGLKPYSEGGDAYKLKNHANENEYYLIENRQLTGWDAALPGSGVLITHMDYDEAIYNDNSINDASDHLRFRVIPADNQYSMKNQEGDAYPYGNNNRLDEKSSPSNEVFNKNTDGSNNLGYSVKNISVSGNGLASFDIISMFGNEENADVNRDNKVNTADIVILNNILVKGDNVDDETWRRADADGNGERNADDIQFIVKTIMGEPGGSAGIIKFKDQLVKELCVKKWDTNGDGELSKEEAAAVERLGSVFNNKDIISFNELQYFTGLSSISWYAFHECDHLTKISIPNNVTRIEGGAFCDCSNLTSITIPNSVNEIDHDAFSGCTGLTTISIPNSVTKIDEGTFYECSSLTSVTIPNSVTKIGNLAFSRCSSLSSITIPNSVTAIGYDAFSKCSSLTSVTIPNSVTILNVNLFWDCTSLTSITIPNSVTEIGNSVFEGCTSLTTISIPNSVTKIGGDVFRRCSSLTSITIPNSVTEIGSAAFIGCTGLTSISIPNSVTKISYDLFKDCCSLTSVTIPNSVTEIGEYSFYGCSSLTSITIPNSVTEIGRYAFEGCNNMTEVICMASERPRAEYAFGANRSKMTLHVPAGSIEKYAAVEPWKKFKEIVAIE